MSVFGIKMNFLEYANITSKIKPHLEWRDIPDYTDFFQRNSFLNIILSIDTKEVSNLYRLLHHKGDQISGYIKSELQEKTFGTLELCRFFFFTIVHLKMHI